MCALPQKSKMIEFNLGISAGDRFKSYEEVLATLESIEREHHVHFYRKDSRTIKQVRDRITRPMDDNLVFYSIKYSCIRGSPRYRKDKTKSARNSRPLQKEELCPAHLYLIVSECGSDLKVSSISNMHNHEITPEICRRKPGSRGFKELTIEGPASFITVSYLKNLLYKEREKYTTNLQLTCERLLQDSESSLFFGDKGLHGISFSTERMRSLFAAYPELMYIDLSYEILPYRTPLYMMIVQDGNDRGHVVGLAILFIEDKDSIKWFLDTFKIVTESDCQRVDSIIVDKDFLHRDLVKEAFPSAGLHLTIVQTFQHFQRDLNFKDMDISPGARTMSLKYLQRLVCSKTEDEFEATLNLIQEICPPCVRRYLNEWIPTKHEWCPRLGRICKFLNTADDHLPEMISIIKSHLADSSICTILERAFLIMEFLNDNYEELYNKTTLDKTKTYPPGSIYHEYEAHLTEFAFKKVVCQIQQMDKIDAHKVEGYFITSTHSSTETRNETTSENCTCHFYKTMILPCKHILKVRGLTEEDSFAPELCHQKWTESYYLKHLNHIIHLEPLKNRTKEPPELLEVEALNCLPETEILDNEYSTSLSGDENIDQSSFQEKHSKIDGDGNIDQPSFQEKHAKILEMCEIIADTASRDSEDNYYLISDLLWTIMDNLRQRNYQNLRELRPILLNNPEERSDSIFADHCDSNEDTFNQERSEDCLIENDFENLELQENGSEGKVWEKEHEDDACPIPNKRAKLLIDEKQNSKCISSEHHSTVANFQENVPFLNKSLEEKQEVLLSFVLKDNVRKEKMSNYQISDLLDYNHIDNRISYVHLSIIEEFFSEQAWAFVLKAKEKKITGTWFCNICGKAFSNCDSSIECSYCLNWSHTDCLEIKHELAGYFKCPKCDAL